MSHIPSSAMKHAGPVHHHEHDAPPPPHTEGGHKEEAGIGTGAWIAIGGTLLAGAASASPGRAAAVPRSPPRQEGDPGQGRVQKQGAQDQRRLTPVPVAAIGPNWRFS